MIFDIAILSTLCICASAAPWGPWSHPKGYPNGPGSSPSGQVPFSYPLSNGFPNIQIPSAALLAIEEQGHGTLPNTPLPTSLNATTELVLQVVVFAELFEVAFFTSLINNITNNVPGFEVGTGAASDTVLNALIPIQAQEELHALGINAILSSAGSTPVQGCEYIFPTNDFDSAIEEASIFTDAVILGGLQDALLTFATDGDLEILPLFISVAEQEGEQNGFFRSIEGNIPSQLPFLTRSTGVFAFSYINQNFIVPGSCPTQINVPIFGKLNVQAGVPASNSQQLEVTAALAAPVNQQLQFSFNNTAGTSTDSLSLVYLNQQDAPIVETLDNVQVNGEEVTFSANFPYQQYLMNGLTVAVVTNSAGPFASADAVANATLFGPALIEIN